MGNKGRSPVDFGAEQLSKEAWPTVQHLSPHPLPGLTGAGPTAGEEVAGSPEQSCQPPALLPTALHINLGADTAIATPRFAPEACGARRDAVRLAVHSEDLIQLVASWDRYEVSHSPFSSLEDETGLTEPGDQLAEFL